VSERQIMQFRVFVYGTLKQGERNFAQYCRGVLAIESASVLGRLYHLSYGYHLPYGYPMLEVPPEHILTVGTRDYVQDAALLTQLAGQPPPVPPVAAGDWELIAGEIQTFDNPLERFAAMDKLEDFRPGGDSLYHRVVLRVQPPQSTLVWTYVAANGRVPEAAVRIGPRWTAS
jgi:gamma-glutamylcyclotransferase (GGCT)/AIG2-like uncharacterized protein YtfP